MMDFILTSILWIFALYGLFDIIKKIIDIYTYSNLNTDGIHLIIAVKNQENVIEGFLRSKLFTTEENLKEIIVTDLDSNDNTLEILNKLSQDYSKIKVVTWDECKMIVDKLEENNYN